MNGVGWLSCILVSCRIWNSGLNWMAICLLPISRFQPLPGTASSFRAIRWRWNPGAAPSPVPHLAGARESDRSPHLNQTIPWPVSGLGLQTCLLPVERETVQGTQNCCVAEVYVNPLFLQASLSSRPAETEELHHQGLVCGHRMSRTLDMGKCYDPGIPVWHLINSGKEVMVQIISVNVWSQQCMCIWRSGWLILRLHEV